MIAEVLGTGKENAKTSEELVRYFGFNTVRELQEVVAKERAAGAVILSTCSGAGGYYLPSDKTEIKEFCRTLENRATNTLVALRSAKKKLNEWDGA